MCASSPRILLPATIGVFSKSSSEISYLEADPTRTPLILKVNHLEGQHLDQFINTMGENFAITLAHDKVIEEPDILFPNGGWDVHHHIFERMCDSSQT